MFHSTFVFMIICTSLLIEEKPKKHYPSNTKKNISSEYNQVTNIEISIVNIKYIAKVICIKINT